MLPPMGERRRETCSQCGEVLPRPVDPDPGPEFYWPRTEYLCGACWAREFPEDQTASE